MYGLSVVRPERGERWVAEVDSLHPQQELGGGDVCGEAVHAKDQRSAEAAVVPGDEPADDRKELWCRAHLGGRVPAASRAGGAGMAVAAGVGGWTVGETALPTTPLDTCIPETAARLGEGPTGIEAQGRDPVPPLGGVPGGASGRLRVQPVLRAARGVGRQVGPGDASGAPGRGEAVRGLRRA